MRNRDALGLARRSRRVDHVGGLLGMNDDIQKRLPARRRWCRRRNRARGNPTRLRPSLLAVDKQQLDAAIGKHARAPDRPAILDRAARKRRRPSARPASARNESRRAIHPEPDRHFPGHTARGKRMREAVRLAFSSSAKVNISLPQRNAMSDGRLAARGSMQTPQCR